jgi:hypothetical protein
VSGWSSEAGYEWGTDESFPHAYADGYFERK